MNQKIRFFTLQLLILVGLFLIAEIIVQIIGFKPGVVEDFYYFNSKVEYDPILVADEYGITHMVKGVRYLEDQKINEDGFASEVEHIPEVMESIRSKNKKVVFLIGDSYTHGCCPDSYHESFAYLINKNPKYEALNFGVGGADPLHYELIARKYTPFLKPDLICVFVYLGNDEMPFARKPKPNIPLAYPIKDGPWLMSEATINLKPPNTAFKSFEEAKDFYFEYFSLWGENRNIVEKVIRYSAILSRIYLKIHEYQSWEKQFENGNIIDHIEKPPFTNTHLKSIEKIAKENNSKVLFFGIPSPEEAENSIDLQSRYSHVFDGLEWHFTSGLTYEHYDGKSVANHFNAKGHSRFKDFIEPIILDKLE